MHFLNRFQFDNHFAIHKQICPKAFVKLDAIKLNRNNHLPLNRKPGFAQAMCKKHFVNGLQQARAQFPVQLDSLTNDNRADFILVHYMA